MTNKSQSFREVVAWQKAHAFVLDLYRVTGLFPAEERFGLISQLRRAAVSVPSNFVEGFRKRTKADKIRFYNMAQGSADECLYQLILSQDLGYANTQELQQEAEEVSRLLQGYINGLERSAA
ncbi:MAG TPA: four helix bundle protein [Candidatus Didemnitutus sp.]|nr:four helix bundle protein [Candidatus Didemnitutus sp.]